MRKEEWNWLPDDEGEVERQGWERTTRLKEFKVRENGARKAGTRRRRGKGEGVRRDIRDRRGPTAQYRGAGKSDTRRREPNPEAVMAKCEDNHGCGSRNPCKDSLLWNDKEWNLKGTKLPEKMAYASMFGDKISIFGISFFVFSCR
jgi:hypothetical protein